MSGYARPIFRWPGGKRRLLKELIPRLPSDIAQRRYVEPFFGGGALFFALAPKRALLNDLNADLINAYACLREQPRLVLDILWPMLRNHDVALYHLVRDLYNNRCDEGIGTDPAAPNDVIHLHYHGVFLRAAWFIYLMATCFNGLYRVNASGDFNTPMGDKISFSHDKVDRAVGVLEGGMVHRRGETSIELRSGDFALIRPEPGDFFFIDPPYAPASATANFTSYAAGGFDDADQSRLRAFTERLTWLDVRWMQTNADVPRIRELYQGNRIEPIMAPRTIAANGDRSDAAELIIRNY